MKSDKENDFKPAVASGNLIVGSGVKITGVVNVTNEMDIYGKVEGAIQVRTLKVHKDAEVNALINCENAEINGEIKSQLTCSNNLLLKENANLSGDISYVHMVMNLGAELNAKMKRMRQR
jgi:cytoskeletal protein CcmA (bactofilin family)